MFIYTISNTGNTDIVPLTFSGFFLVRTSSPLLGIVPPSHPMMNGYSSEEKQIFKNERTSRMI